ncbi:MAG: gamma-glutamyl-gamma-aminobutyrate hydrolase family protein [Coriobacteriales bacterium]
MPRSFPDIIQAIGAMPVYLPHLIDRSDMIHYIEGASIVMALGGFDIDPSTYTDEEPSPTLSPTSIEYDDFEISMLRCAHELDVPALCICRGTQIMNVAFGGDLYQDIETQRAGYSYNHMQGQPFDNPTHEVEVIPNTKLAQIIGKGVHRVNSMHHQAIKEIPDEFVASAISGDGVIEAIEDPAKKLFLGVQWHPEEMHGPLGLETMLRNALKLLNNAPEN